MRNVPAAAREDQHCPRQVQAPEAILLLPDSLQCGQALNLLDWQHIYGALLGNVGWSVPIDVPGNPAPEDAEIRSIFTSGDSMHRKRGGVPRRSEGNISSGLTRFYHVSQVICCRIFGEAMQVAKAGCRDGRCRMSPQIEAGCRCTPFYTT